ncbi:hypothetical protein DVB87_23465 [Tsukamurella tyrosinosolvens]|nr:hypothetical protein DVB87_23465 [Tsukamurella tyrosinosolvens]
MNGSAGCDRVSWFEAAERRIAECALATAIAEEIAELEAADAAAHETTSLSDEASDEAPSGWGGRVSSRARRAAAIRPSSVRPSERPVARRHRITAHPLAARSP